MNTHLKAILFDFDGVVADTEPLHLATFQRVLAHEGMWLPAEAYASKYVGLSDHSCFEAVFRDHGIPVSLPFLTTLAERKTQLMQSAIAVRNPVLPQSAAFVRRAARTYRLAIASGALRKEIDLCLKDARLLRHFEHITSAEDVKRGKPAPDSYLHALHTLDAASPLRASECLVIEDTAHGIRAAHAAGMRCLAVTTTSPASLLTEADWTTPSLDFFDLDLVARFWSQVTARRTPAGSRGDGFRGNGELSQS